MSQIVAPHLKRLATRIANTWLFEDPSGQKFLIDTSHPIERIPLVTELWRAGIRLPGDLTAIFLTHRHSDHAGNAAFLRKYFRARVICHRADAAILSGEKRPLALESDQPMLKRMLCRAEDLRPAHCEVDDVYEEGEWKWGFRIYPVPGHTEGSVMIWHDRTKTLFSGDSILVGTPFNRRGKKLRAADPDYSVEPETALRSIKRFLEEVPPAEFLCSGHGPVVDEAVQQGLRKLLKTL
jgi:glyoxylase-like metal-dependent hydrolase (beta-lactamase superfamily II)